VTATWLIPERVEIVRPPSDADAAGRGDEIGYDVLYPVRPGEQDQWTRRITHIFLRGAPRALRQGGRVNLKAGREVFWSAPVLEVLTRRRCWLLSGGLGKLIVQRPEVLIVGNAHTARDADPVPS